MHQLQHSGSVPYGHQWHLSNAAPSSSSSPSDSVVDMANDCYPQADLDNSFRKTLLEIEDTFYKTFPAAAHAIQRTQRWGTASGGVCEDQNIFFFSQAGGPKMDMDVVLAQAMGPQPAAAFASAGPTSRNYVSSDVLMSDCTPLVHVAGTHHHQQLNPTPSVIGPQGSYRPKSSSISATATGSYVPDPAQGSLASPTRSADSGAVSGSLSDAFCMQSDFRGARDSACASSYVTSNPINNDRNVLPVSSLSSAPNLSHLPTAPPAPTAPPLLGHYPTQTAPRAISDPSPSHPIPTGYYPVASHSNSPNHSNPYHPSEPAPSSPPPITLYPVPQAPLNHHIAPWPPHDLSPEPLPHRHSPREASSGRSTARRKRGKDNDKKPPLACLFCRGRKIACGPPAPDGDGKTCNQCHRRSLKCDYPAESRRGMRKDKTLQNLNTGGGTAKVILKTRKR